MTSSATLGVNRLIPSLGVSDIQRSVSFYQEFFGFEVEDSYARKAVVVGSEVQKAESCFSSSPPISRSVQPGNRAELGDTSARRYRHDAREVEAGLPSDLVTTSCWRARSSSLILTAMSCGLCAACRRQWRRRGRGEMTTASGERRGRRGRRGRGRGGGAVAGAPPLESAFAQLPH